MSKLRDNIIAKISAAVAAADPNIRITDLRLLLMRTRRAAEPPEAHHRIWMEEMHKQVQRTLKARKAARDTRPTLFTNPSNTSLL